MAESKKILIVEGDADKSFFEKVSRKLSINASVKVPKDLRGNRNSKEGVFEQLKLHLPQLNGGAYSHIAIVVDADYRQYHGLGYQATIDRVSEIVHPYDFELVQNSVHGIRFKNTEGLADFGLWIMPDNRQEGMLEDFIKRCIKESEQALFQQAMKAVQQISKPKFSEHLTTKAEVATWLAWQKQPGHGLYGAINDELLDIDSALFNELKQWLLRVFAETAAGAEG
ncbi:MAG: hypothetical protein IBX56_07130 [Methylomicrobium sp.]|nr:hypothetical protein [Methylomicrobium sp.]